MLNTFSNPEFRLSEQNFSRKMVQIKEVCIKYYNLTLLLQRMLEKDPDQRFDINEVDDELKRIDKPTPVLTTKDIFKGIFSFLI